MLLYQALVEEGRNYVTMNAGTAALKSHWQHDSNFILLLFLGSRYRMP